MNSIGPNATRSDAAQTGGGPSGLSPEHKVALTEATHMIANGQSQEAAVDHLVSCGMPRVVAKVLVKKMDRKSSVG